MSTDSTELTFVRCPSCRSLVPAISTRCRMCGATLEAAAAVDSGDQEPRKSGRVRQRTMSEPSSEVSSALDNLRESKPMEPTSPVSTPVTPPKSTAQSAAAIDRIDDDPLSSYLEEEELDADSAEEQELETEPAPVAKAAPTSIPAPAVSDDDDDADDDDEGADTLEQSNGALDDLLDLNDEDPLADFTKPLGSEEPAAAAPPPEPPAPRVVVESGGRKGDRPSQLNFGAPKEQPEPQARAGQQSSREQERQRPQSAPPRQQQQEQRPRQEARPAQPQQQPNNQRPAQGPTGQQSRPQNQPQHNSQQRGGQSQPPQNGSPRPQGGAERQQHGGDRRPQSMQPPVAPVREEPRQQPAAVAAQARPEQQMPPQQRRAEVEAPAQPAQRPTPPAHEHRPPASHSVVHSGAKVDLQVGRLFGWFVNYSDSNGAAIEIREGKFFVSSKSVKPNDMVIEDRTISAPHALLNVSASGGLIVQDLMSERGVHVRRKGSDTYRREEEPVSVTHGDWVRFGDMEFLVSLIAYPGEN